MLWNILGAAAAAALVVLLIWKLRGLMLTPVRTGQGTEQMCIRDSINTASIQLLPTTVAAVRAANGSAAPFDILPAVWISSIASVTVGVLAAKLFEGFSRK